MSKVKQTANVLSVVAYTPPKLYVGVEWYIGFMAFDPAVGRMRRKKIKLNHIAKIGESKSRKTKRDGCEKRNAFFLSKTKCASNLIRKATVHLQNQSKTPSFH